ncbi:unnamed protein product, partial [Prorocentrum cordatum]
ALLRGAVAEEPSEPAAPAEADDISKEGACKDAAAEHCASVTEGQGELARCLRDAIKASHAFKAHASGEGAISKLCQHEVRHFFVKVMGHESPTKGGFPFWVEPVKGLRKACSEDIKSFCVKARGPNLTACLKEHKAELSAPCSTKVFEVQELQAEDMQLDKFFYEACQADLQNIEPCTKVPARLRKACLAAPKYRESLTDRCKEALFKKEVEESDDIRLSPDALNDCQEAITTVCKDVPFGEARMLECLWNKVVADEDETGTYEACSAKVLQMVGRQVSHYKLDFGVRTKCVADVQEHCSAEKEKVDKLPIGKAIGPDSEVGPVIQCLEKNLRSLKPECHKEISRVVRIQAQRADLAPQIRSGCQAELRDLCKDVAPGDQHTCLRSHFQDLGKECRAAEMRQSKVEMDAFVLRPKTGQVCKYTADKFCPGLVWGEKLNCLQDHMYQESFARGCRHAITADLEANNHDWQLKYGVSSQCQEDVQAHCGEASKTSGTAVLECLGEAHTAGHLILDGRRHSADGCRIEVGRYLKGGAENIQVLPEAHRACKADVEQFCKKTPAGRGRVHTCLVHHKEDLSEECAAAEFKNQAAMSNDIRMSPEAQERCGPVMEKLCPGVEPGGGRMWACLFKQRASPDMPRECVEVLRGHNKLKQREFFLNPSLAKHCNAEALRLCPEQMEQASRKDFTSNGGVITCLIEKRKQIEDQECGNAVDRKHAERVADASLDPDHEDACRNDIERFCNEAKKSALHSRGTSGVVHRCLQEHIDDLSDDCAQKEKQYMVAASENTRLNLEVDQHCKQAKTRWCEGTPDEEGSLTMCLLQHMHDDNMEPPCRTALEGEQKKAASSLRYNPQLRKMCSSELTRFRKEGKCSKKGKKGGWVDCIQLQRGGRPRPGLQGSRAQGDAAAQRRPPRQAGDARGLQRGSGEAVLQDGAGRGPSAPVPAGEVRRHPEPGVQDTSADGPEGRQQECHPELRHPEALPKGGKDLLLGRAVGGVQDHDVSRAPHERDRVR